MKSFAGIRQVLAATLFCLAAFGIGTAAAQISPFAGSGFQLTKEDIAILNEASAPIFQDPPVPLNSRYDWSNPKSGNSGAVTLISRFQREGLPCVRARYNVKVHDVADPFQYDLRYCRVADGQWKGV